MIADLAPLAPMLALAVTVLVIVVTGWTVRDPRVAPGIAGVGLAISALLAWRGFGALRPGRAIEAFPRQVNLPDGTAAQAALVRVDAFGLFVVVVLALIGLIVVLLGADYVARLALGSADYHALVLVALLAMMLLAVAGDLMLVFLAIETFSLALYMLCAFRRGDRFGHEAAFKYFLLGAFSAGFLLYGVALAYAATGTTDLVLIGAALGTDAGAGPVALAGLGLLLVGLSFKIAAAPFHQWTPDVYAGAPLPVTALMAAGTKLAAFAVLIRVLATAFAAQSDLWVPLLAALAVVTMVVGNLAALVQADVKRMLGYSAVAHAGYVLVAVVAGAVEPAWRWTALFYLVVYAATNLGAFAVLAGIGAIGPSGRDAALLDDLRGLWRRQPWLAAALALFLFSLTGLPPTAGFLAKWYVFQAAVGSGYLWLAVVLVLNSAASAFYYLRPVALMAMAEPEDASAIEVATPAAVAVATMATVVGLALFLAGPLVDGARAGADRAARHGPPPTVAQDEGPETAAGVAAAR